MGVKTTLAVAKSKLDEQFRHLQRHGGGVDDGDAERGGEFGTVAGQTGAAEDEHLRAILLNRRATHFEDAGLRARGIARPSRARSSREAGRTPAGCQAKVHDMPNLRRHALARAP